jgi:hypothetical protein
MFYSLKETPSEYQPETGLTAKDHLTDTVGFKYVIFFNKYFDAVPCDIGEMAKFSGLPPATCGVQAPVGLCDLGIRERDF